MTTEAASTACPFSFFTVPVTGTRGCWALMPVIRQSRPKAVKNCFGLGRNIYDKIKIENSLLDCRLSAPPSLHGCQLNRYALLRRPESRPPAGTYSSDPSAE